MRKSLFALMLTMALAAGIPAKGQEPVWKIHSRWCTTDRGSSGTTYQNTCRKYDQFESVIACQQDAHNDGAVQSIRDAGRKVVNEYMDSYKPKECI
jgi:hypothetical protein